MHTWLILGDMTIKAMHQHPMDTAASTIAHRKIIIMKYADGQFRLDETVVLDVGIIRKGGGGGQGVRLGSFGGRWGRSEQPGQRLRRCRKQEPASLRRLPPTLVLGPPDVDDGNAGHGQGGWAS